MRFLAICAALVAASPVAASTVLTFQPGALVSFSLTGPNSGYRYSVSIQGGSFDVGDPSIQWNRDITYGYNGGLGYIEYNDIVDDASCSPEACTSLAIFTRLTGTPRNLQVKNLPGFDTCSLNSPLYETCAYYTGSDLGRVSFFAEPVEGSGLVTVTISDQSAVPEPASWALLVIGFAAAGVAGRRRLKLSAEPA